MVLPEVYDPDAMVMICLDCGEGTDAFSAGQAGAECAFGYPPETEG
jgi:hypothetical protein